MKKIATLLIIITTFLGCKKYEPLEELPNIEETEWVLVSGRTYTENLSSGEKFYYDHFSSSKTTSNLDIFGGSSIDFDNVEVNVTTWYFSNEVFTLNNLQSYEYTKYSGQYNIIGLPNGSSRDLGVIEFNEDVMTVILYESNESYNGDNYHYYSTLTFTKVGVPCNGCGVVPNDEYEYMGVIIDSLEPIPGNQSLVGTSWVITRYDEGVTPYYPNDTINFISTLSYDINGGTPLNYSLSNNTGNNLYNLTLYECVTFGGNYSGQVGLTFIDYGILNNLQMNGIFGTNGSINVWMERI
jgi:hypothetical protein